VLDAQWQTRIAAAHDQLAQDGMRVLGVAFRALPAGHGTDATIERDLIFVGLLGIIDPARNEARAAVQTCRTAGIRPVMITGDHPLTAAHIARRLGLAGNERILTGPELQCCAPGELDAVVETTPVYARVAPEQKLTIVQALQRQGHLVAMTGDGVNDAPALRQADIGVAMGVTGSDVAKEAADMVLLDDNFATIVAAVEEGRVIYDNIRKFIKYLLASNTGEILVMLLGPLFGMPLPLLPLQILWMNLVTDGLPALALSFEPAERGIMQRPPYRPTEQVLGGRMAREIVLLGTLMGILALGAGYWYWQADSALWQTMLFTILTLSQMALALGIRSERDTLRSIGLRSNTPLLLAVTLTLVLQLAVIYVPWLQAFFHTVALPVSDLLLTLGLSLIVLLVVEGQKWIVGHRGTRRRTMAVKQAP
jgi:Ca2+-transporting ATPase